ncbi:MAG: hypothetical protein JXR96_17230 [Deltaproteobacteria bacterium]|nr:hypothetical protein [Deltaproteobacteria bacterium]
MKKVVLLTVLCSLLASLRLAAGPLGPHDCPALLGDEQSRQENRAFRTSLLSAVSISDHAIGIVHRGDWDTPRRIRFQGLRLVETRSRGEEALGVVELSEEGCVPGCARGAYALRADDALGPQGRVLAVLDGVVLLEHDGELRYLLAAGSPEPVWRMIWRSSWTMLKVPGQQAGISSPPPAQRASPSSASKHRRGKKR